MKMNYRNTGQIIRSKKDGTSGYTPISNKILQSKIMTPVQKSLLVHLISLKSDWAIRKTHLHKDMNIGRDSFNKAWGGLVEMGHIVQSSITKKNLKAYHYIIYEDPNPVLLDTSVTENQLNRNTASIESNDLKSNNLENNTEVSNNIKTSILGENEIEVSQHVELNSKIENLVDDKLEKNSGNKFEPITFTMPEQYEIGKILSQSTLLGKDITGMLNAGLQKRVKTQIGDEKYSELQPLIERYLKLIS